MVNGKVRQKGQISLETALVIGAMAVLILAAAGVWFWFGQDMNTRIDVYKSTRLNATNPDIGEPGQQINYTTAPLDIFKPTTTAYRPAPPGGGGGLPVDCAGTDIEALTDDVNRLFAEAQVLNNKVADLSKDMQKLADKMQDAAQALRRCLDFCQRLFLGKNACRKSCVECYNDGTRGDDSNCPSYADSIKGLEQRIREKQKQMEQLQKQIDAKNARIQELQNKIDEWMKKCT